MIDLTGSTPSAVAAKLSSLLTSSTNSPDSSVRQFTSVIEGFLEPSQTGSPNDNNSNSNSAPDVAAAAAERGSTPEFVSGCAWMLGDSAARPAGSISTTVTSAPASPSVAVPSASSQDDSFVSGVAWML